MVSICKKEKTPSWRFNNRYASFKSVIWPFSPLLPWVNNLTMLKCYFQRPYIITINNRLLTERDEGHTREYWLKVVTVGTKRSEVRTKTNEGKYSPVRPKKARLVSSLLYGTLFLIVKCTARGLHFKMFVVFIHLWNFGKISIFSASSGSFNVKNDNIHTFFRCFGCKFWICRLRSKTKIQRFDGLYCKIMTEKDHQSTGICLTLGLPYNIRNY